VSTARRIARPKPIAAPRAAPTSVRRISYALQVPTRSCTSATVALPAVSVYEPLRLVRELERRAARGVRAYIIESLRTRDVAAQPTRGCLALWGMCLPTPRADPRETPTSGSFGVSGS
jgi:hypothetical protein